MQIGAQPSEMLIQMLFATYAYSYAEELGKRLLIFAPTQAEEELLAYDTSLIGDGCRELYIQFKRPVPHESAMDIRIKIDNTPSRKHGTCQLDTLKANYPSGSAYYVTGGFSSVLDTFLAQQDKAADRKSFLDAFIGIDAQSVELPTKRDGSSQASAQVLICMQSLGDWSRPAFAPSILKVGDLNHLADWRYGSELLREFISGGPSVSVGCDIVRENGEYVRKGYAYAPIDSLGAYRREAQQVVVKRPSADIYRPQITQPGSSGDDAKSGDSAYNWRIMLRVFDTLK